MKNFAKNGLWTTVLAAILLLGWGAATPASAHRMNIFAWLEGGNVLVECGFGRAQPVIGGQVTVYDNVTNRELLQGRTNRQGAFSFAVPDVIREGHGLRIVVNGGQGHVGEWVMEASQLYDASAVEAGLARAQLAANGSQNTPAEPVGARAASPAPLPAATAAQPLVENPDAPATRAHVHEIVSDVLDAKLAPLHRRLAAMEDRGIGITEVFGGIGWLVGIFALWVYYRGKKH